jgi:hypothetical protein
MFRAVLIAYMCAATVTGPLVCCCTLRAAAPAEGGGHCCSGHEKAASTHARSGHDHHHEHRHASHGHSPAVASTDEGSPSGKEDPGEHHCPCGRRHATTLTVAAIEHGMVRGFDLPIPVWMPYEACDLLLTEICGPSSAINAYSVPPGLFGRDMLRAYQIMRC